MFCNFIDFLCRFYVFLHLNLLNFVKITYACENSELQQLVLRNVLNPIRGTHVIYDPEWMSITLLDWTTIGPSTVDLHFRLIANSMEKKGHTDDFFLL